MLQFIIQYWVEFLFGLIISGLSVWARYHWKQFKKAKAQTEKNFLDKVKTEIDSTYEQTKKDDIILKEEINSITQQVELLQKGILSLQGKEFKQECAKLLKVDHKITLEEYEQLMEDHEAYNGLGGNHKGDQLFTLVTEKFEKNLNKK